MHSIFVITMTTSLKWLANIGQNHTEYDAAAQPTFYVAYDELHGIMMLIHKWKLADTCL